MGEVSSLLRRKGGKSRRATRADRVTRCFEPCFSRSPQHRGTSLCTPPLCLQTMLLCNLTVSDDGCKDLLQLGQDKREGLNM